jgi:stress-induced-phosphoprotein 1
LSIEPFFLLRFSNRSACYASQRLFEKAAADADRCVSLNPKWAKGYGRKGAALHGLEDFDGAIAAYEEGLKLEPGNAQCKKVPFLVAITSRDLNNFAGH